MKIKKKLLFLFSLIPNICMADLTDLASYEDLDKTQIENIIKEIRRRYPDTKSIDFKEDINKNFAISLIRSVLAQKVYEEYEAQFIEKFKSKSASTGRPIVNHKMENVDINSEIKNITKHDGLTMQYHISNEEYDKIDCFGSGQMGENFAYRTCEIPDDYEQMKFQIGYSVRGNGVMSSKFVSLVEYDLTNSMVLKTDVYLNYNYNTLQDDKFVDTSLKVTTQSSTIHDANSIDRQIAAQLEKEIKFGVQKDGEVYPTIYDEDAKNAAFKIKIEGVDIKGSDRPGSNNETNKTKNKLYILNR